MTVQIPSGLYALKDETHYCVPQAAAYPMLSREDMQQLNYFRNSENPSILELSINGYISPYAINYYTRVLELATRAQDVKGVLMEIKTAGGMVDQLVAFADFLYKYVKPIVTHTSYCCSAGYWIASQTNEIHAEPQSSTEIGSIGTIYIHYDQSGMYEKQGTKVHIFRSDGSTRKAVPNSFEPLDQQSADRFQARVTAANVEFKSYVRRGRGMRIKSDIIWEGDTFDADGAVAVGLADRKGTYAQALERVIKLSDK